MRQWTTVPRYRSRCHVAAPRNVPVYGLKMQHTNALDDLAVDSTVETTGRVAGGGSAVSFAYAKYSTDDGGVGSNKEELSLR